MAGAGSSANFAKPALISAVSSCASLASSAFRSCVSSGVERDADEAGLSCIAAAHTNELDGRAETARLRYPAHCHMRRSRSKAGERPQASQAISAIQASLLESNDLFKWTGYCAVTRQSSPAPLSLAQTPCVSCALANGPMSTR